MEKLFRFQNLHIWQEAIQLTNALLEIANNIEKRRLYRFSEQLRGAAMSISNNIAEGSGSNSKKEFAYFINIARRSAFECVNILIIFQMRMLIDKKELNQLTSRLNVLCRRMTNFKKSLR